MDTKKQRQRRRNDARLTESGNARSEQLNTRACGAYRVANQQSLACLSGSEHRSPGWFLDTKYQTCSVIFSILCNYAHTCSDIGIVHVNLKLRCIKARLNEFGIAMIRSWLFFLQMTWKREMKTLITVAWSLVMLI